MNPNPIQQQATYLLQQLKKQQEPDGGMLFFKAVMQCQLNDTPESIGRLDELFRQMSQKGISLNYILQQPNHKNFLLTIAVYIGHYIGKQLGEVPAWYGFDNFKGFKKHSDTPREFPFSLVAQFAYGVSLPMGSIMEAIKGTDSIANYIKDTIFDILSKSRVNVLQSATDICNEYLKKVRTGRLIDNEMAYLHLLKNITFDYSYQSLIEIDKMLNFIKTNEHLTQADYDRFVNDIKRQQFIYFLGCYIASTASQLAKATHKWFNYQEMKKIMNNPDFTFCIETNQVVMFDGDYIRLPLMAITNYFFDMNPNSSIGAKNYADNVLRENKSNLSSYSLLATSNKQLPPHWKVISTALPLLVEPSLHTISAGLESPLNSLYLEMENDNINYFYTSPMFSSEQEMKSFMDKPHGNPYYNFLCYEGYVNLPTGRTDALIIEAKVFAEPKLDLKLMLPYRSDNHFFGLAFYPLVNKQTDNFTDEDLKAITQNFYAGIKNIVLKGKNMKFEEFYIDKHDLFAPAKWLSEPIESFDPSQSEIEILPL